MPLANSVLSISPRTVPGSHSHSPHHSKPDFNGGLAPQLVVPSMPNAIAPHRTQFYQQSAGSGSGSTQAEPSRKMGSSELSDQNREYGSQDVYPYRNSLHSTVASSVYTVGGGDRISGSWAQSDTGDWDAMAIDPSSPQVELPPQSSGQPMDIQSSPMAQEDPSRPDIHDDIPEHSVVHHTAQGVQSGGHKLRLASLGFGKKPSKWGGFFSHSDKIPQNVLSPVDEMHVASTSSTPSLKRTQSSSTDSRSLSELSPEGEQDVSFKPAMDPKMRKKEAERVEKEAEKVRRAMAEKRSREQARAVMQKRNLMIKQNSQGADLDWESSNSASLLGVQKAKAKQRQGSVPAASSSATVNAAGGRFRGANEDGAGSEGDQWRELEYRNKARRRDMDDDHSMSSSDVQSVSRLSVISFATVDSDPGPARIRQRPSLFGINRMQSTSSLRTSFGDDSYPVSARSSNSLSLEQQLVNDFDSRASFSSYDAARSSFSDTSSPPPMQMLSLSSHQQPRRQAHPSFITLPPPITSMHSQHLQTPGPTSPYEYGQNGHIQTHPPSPGIAPHSAINPMFKVV